jgi:hypothetical protein
LSFLTNTKADFVLHSYMTVACLHYHHQYHMFGYYKYINQSAIMPSYDMLYCFVIGSFTHSYLCGRFGKMICDKFESTPLNLQITCHIISCARLSIFFKCTCISLFTGGTFFIKICTIFMNILYNTLLNQDVSKNILGR